MMKNVFVRAAAVAAAATGTLIASSALADNVVMTPQQQPAPQQTTAPATGTTVVNNQPPAVGTTTTTAAPAPVIVNGGSTPVTHERAEGTYEGPNTALLWSGAVMLGLSWGAGAVVGSESPLSEDRALFVPVAGPWIDLGTRPARGDRGEETAAKVGLAVDGVFQGLGALQIIGAFVWPRRHDTVTTAKVDSKKIFKPTFHVAPTHVGIAGYGLGAGGTF